MTEQQLIKACLKGNRKAQFELYRRYEVPMFGLCLRYAKTDEEAEDYLQEGFIKVFKDLRQFSGKSSLKKWMERIMINTALMDLRKRKIVFENQSFNLVQSSRKAEHILDYLNTQQIIEQIQNLPIGYRTVFNLYAIEGYSHKEIGKQLGITESTSRSQYTRARKLLQQRIQKLNLAQS